MVSGCGKSSLAVDYPVQDLTGDLVTYESIVSNYDMSASGANEMNLTYFM